MGIASRTIEFGRMTNIFGRNGSWKTSVKEAIIYAFTGAIYGTPQIDGAILNGTDYLSVVLDFEHDGKAYILERRRPLDAKGFSVTKLNGAEVKQDNISDLFGTYDEFISGICVGEFMNLEEIDAKFDLINNLIKWDPKKIYDEMVGSVVAEKYPFGTLTYKEVDFRVKWINTEIETIWVKRQQISARIQEIGTPMKPTLTMDSNSIDLIRSELASHNTKRPEMEQVPTSTSELDAIDLEIRAQENELLKLAKPDATELHSLKTRYDMLTEQYNAIEHAKTCQTCLRPFPENEIKAQLDKKKVDMDAILETGKGLKATFTAANEGYEMGRANINNRIDQLRARRNQIQNQITMANTGSVDTFNAKMRSWENIRNDIQTRLTQAEDTYRQEHAAMENWNSASDRIETLKNEDKELVESLSKFDLAALEVVKEALSPKGVTFKEMEKKIAEILLFFPTGVDIELLKKNKSNDEYKKVFNVSMDGVPYKWLSKGMKKVVDTHFANLISEKKGYNVLIIDDIESLTSSIWTTLAIQQTITLCAKDVDFEVKVS